MVSDGSKNAVFDTTPLGTPILALSPNSRKQLLVSVSDIMRLNGNRIGDGVLMDKTSYEEVTQNLLEVIQYCLDKVALGPALILLYSGIDTMAWLDRDVKHDDVLPGDFENWVKDFMLPGTNLRCKPSDLYAARCSVLHSHAAESRLSRKQAAKPIFYAFGNRTSQELQEHIDESKDYSDTIAIQIESLVDAFRKGIERFNQNLSENSERANKVHQRAKKMLVTFKC